MLLGSYRFLTMELEPGAFYNYSVLFKCMNGVEGVDAVHREWLGSGSATSLVFYTLGLGTFACLYNGLWLTKALVSDILFFCWLMLMDCSEQKDGYGL